MDTKRHRNKLTMLNTGNGWTEYQLKVCSFGTYCRNTSFVLLVERLREYNFFVNKKLYYGV